MPALYPASIKTFTRKRDLLDIVLAADINLVYDEVTAVETILGTVPATNLGWTSGSFDQVRLGWSSVRERIQNIEYGLYSAFNDRVQTSGGSTILPAANATVGLTVKARTGQTGDLFQAKNSSDAVITKINSTGRLLVNNSEVLSAAEVQTITNKTIDGNNNSFLNIPTASVVVSGQTDIQEYVEARPTVYYQATAPVGIIPGTVWVDSSENIDPFDASALLLDSDPSVAVGFIGYRRIGSGITAPSPSTGADGDVYLQYI